MDNIIQKAIEDLDKLKKEVASAQTRIQKLELFVSTYEELAAQSHPTDQPTESESQFKLDANANSKKPNLRVLVREILQERQPLSTQEIFEELAKRGASPTSIGSVSVALSTAKDQFLSNRKTGWTIKKAEPQDATTS